MNIPFPSQVNSETFRRRLIDTYDPPNELDPHELVEDYEAFTDYIAKNPNASSYAVASSIEAPRGRIRAWMDNGAMPDAAAAVYEAERKGWLDTDTDTHILLTRLVAAVLAGGSIGNDTYSVSFSIDDREHIETLCHDLGVGLRRTKRERENSGDELHPKRNQTLLGRVLVARGASAGAKTHVSSVPSYLFDEQHGAAADAFLETYLRLRGVSPEDRQHVQILERSRTPEYLDSLYRLFDERLPGEVRRSNIGLRIPESTYDSRLWLRNVMSDL